MQEYNFTNSNVTKWEEKSNDLIKNEQNIVLLIVPSLEQNAQHLLIKGGEVCVMVYIWVVHQTHRLIGEALGWSGLGGMDIHQWIDSLMIL